MIAVNSCSKCQHHIVLHFPKWRASAFFGTCSGDKKYSPSTWDCKGDVCVPQKKLSEAYNPSKVEDSVRRIWRGIEAKKKNENIPNNSSIFSMLLPPPNVTGTLHLGHALTVTIQDVLARWHRMQGRRVLWIPGLDHAGIATQTTFEKKLLREKGLTRYNIGREEFVRELWKWKEEKGSIIVQQLKKLGAILDWSKEFFTLDSRLSEAVNEAFVRLFESGVIYRSNALVNWSCALQSTISDIEVDRKEIEGRVMLKIPGYNEPVEFGTLVSFAYKVHGQDGEIVVATSRLETMLGDMAIAVHPDDDRYKKWHGSMLEHPFRRDKIPVICDHSVDPNFGTGAVKVTPAHSVSDFEIGKKNNLELLSVINEDGTLSECCGSYAGLKKYEGRKKLKDDLKQLGLFREEKGHAMSLPVCSRSGDIVELLLKPQWFLSCEAMTKSAINAVESKELLIIPESYEKIWYNWLGESKDWCISRQLWWGHRVPAYKCTVNDTGESVWVAAKNEGEARIKAARKLNLGSEGMKGVTLRQDEDVLDTWFSSALLPFSALDWPLQTENLRRFYPLSFMETGHDILFFWVARMVMLGTTLTGKLPFGKVFLHGVICDAQGRKMSKSRGNVIEPEHVIAGISCDGLKDEASKKFETGLLSKEELKKTLEGQRKMFPKGIPECGVDALRFTLCSQNVSSNYVSFDVISCYKNRQFCNKIWQACRYIEKCYFDVYDNNEVVARAPLRKVDRWILSRLSNVASKVNQCLAENSFHFAVYHLKQFLYDEFCDVYVEATKPSIRACDESSLTSVETLVQCMEAALRLLCPFMPFLTEHLYQNLPRLETLYFADSITSASFPSHEDLAPYRNRDLDDEIRNTLSVVSAIRHLLSSNNVSVKEKPHVYIQCYTEEEQHLYEENAELISTLTRISNLQITSDLSNNIKETSLSKIVSDTCCVYLVACKTVVRDTDDGGKKSKSLVKELKKLRKMMNKARYKPGDPEHEQHSQRIVALEAELKKLKEEDGIRQKV